MCWWERLQQYWLNQPNISLCKVPRKLYCNVGESICVLFAYTHGYLYEAQKYEQIIAIGISHRVSNCDSPGHIPEHLWLLRLFFIISGLQGQGKYWPPSVRIQTPWLTPSSPRPVHLLKLKLIPLTPLQFTIWVLKKNFKIYNQHFHKYLKGREQSCCLALP